jgi:hypothetical protein
VIPICYWQQAELNQTCNNLFFSSSFPFAYLIQPILRYFRKNDINREKLYK